MSRYIDADALKEWLDEYLSVFKKYDKGTIKGFVDHAPSIDIVRCKECKWLRYCETEELDLYLDCDKPDGGGIPRNEEWFCADGEREGE